MSYSACQTGPSVSYWCQCDELQAFPRVDAEEEKQPSGQQGDSARNLPKQQSQEGADKADEQARTSPTNKLTRFGDVVSVGGGHIDVAAAVTGRAGP
jgi:hypothetical protein